MTTDSASNQSSSACPSRIPLFVQLIGLFRDPLPHLVRQFDELNVLAVLAQQLGKVARLARRDHGVIGSVYQQDGSTYVFDGMAR